MKNQKGITLIALVITIIVLLILAGVTIATLTGENGILTQADSAKDSSNRAEAIEKINLALNAVKASIYAQQVSEPTYQPIDDNGMLDSNIKNILEKDQIKTTEANNTYAYKLESDGTLKISYYNTETEVGTQSQPIYGKIDLSTAPYEIKELAK